MPTCCLKRTDTDFVLYQGDEEVKRFPDQQGDQEVKHTLHAQAGNAAGSPSGSDTALLSALQTLSAMRQAGACK